MSSIRLPKNPYTGSLAEISRAQWDLWKESFEPVETQLRNSFNNFDIRTDNQVRNVRNHVATGLDAARGSNAREMDRFQAFRPRGMNAVNDRLDNLALAAGETDGVNNARLAAVDRKGRLAAGLTALGLSSANLAQNTYGQVAGMAQDRINQSVVTNARAGGLMGGLTGALSGYMMGGPMGAVLGGMAGAGSGYYANR